MSGLALRKSGLGGKSLTLTQEEMNNYTVILHEELIPAMGCTEPIAIAYAAAKAKSLFKGDLERFTVNCSGNIITSWCWTYCIPRNSSRIISNS